LPALRRVGDISDVMVGPHKRDRMAADRNLDYCSIETASAQCPDLSPLARQILKRACRNAGLFFVFNLELFYSLP
ncbi:MAG: hypothetical protein PVH25_13115, partial [Burkholderiales bacterium]